ncbi:hypothetical protein [Spirillospora sp. NPDC047279]|uniref:hypothetical protein n=1 Tax=Spirillospora sp. NPDC047279 TaxID=3155478 RepID=UPI00340E1F16
MRDTAVRTVAARFPAALAGAALGLLAVAQPAGAAAAPPPPAAGPAAAVPRAGDTAPGAAAVAPGADDPVPGTAGALEEQDNPEPKPNTELKAEAPFGLQFGLDADPFSVSR